MARKKSYGKNPAETMRQRQQRLLKEQRARKAAASKFVKTKPESSTPRGAQGPRTAPQQGPSQRTGGLQGTRSRAAVRRSAPKPAFSTKSAPKQKALPPGEKGGALATTNKPRRRNVNTNPSSNVTRTGSQSPASIKRELAAVRRAQAEIGRKRAGPLSTLVGTAIEALLRPIARGIGYQGAKAVRKTLGGGEPTLDSKGNPIKKETTSTAASRKAKEDQYNRAVNAAKTTVKSTKPKATPTSAPSPAPTYTPPKGKATAPPKKTGANDPRNAAYIAARKKLNANSTKAERDKVRDMGIKLFKGMQGNKNKKKKDEPKQSAANRAGYQGNRNY